MKDKDGYYTVLVWVVERIYDEDRAFWDYGVQQKDNTQEKWIGEEYWRREKQLKRA